MAHECSECSFVQDAETIRTFLVTRDDKKMATKKPRFIGKFTMSGWTGHSGFYLFKCEECGNVCVDYPHGYTSFGLMYLRCNYCKELLTLEVKEERPLYERENFHIPPEILEERRAELYETIAGIEEQGIRVIVPGLPPPRATTVRDWFRRFRFRKKTSRPVPISEDTRRTVEEDGDDDLF